MSEPDKQPTCDCKDYGAELQELCRLVKELCKLQSVLNQKVDAALSGKPTFDVL